jgi:hypothetical protein
MLRGFRGSAETLRQKLEALFYLIELLIYSWSKKSEASVFSLAALRLPI